MQSSAEAPKTYELHAGNQMFRRLSGNYGYDQNGYDQNGYTASMFDDHTQWGSDYYSDDMVNSRSTNDMIRESDNWGASGGQSSGTHDDRGYEFYDTFSRNIF